MKGDKNLQLHITYKSHPFERSLRKEQIKQKQKNSDETTIFKTPETA